MYWLLFCIEELKKFLRIVFFYIFVVSMLRKCFVVSNSKVFEESWILEMKIVVFYFLEYIDEELWKMWKGFILIFVGLRSFKLLK